MSDIKFKSSNENSPNKFVPAFAIGAGISMIGSAIGAISAGKQQREAERKEADAREEMMRLREVYSNLDTSNPFEDLTNRFEGLQNQYVGLENTAEDMTINQQQAQFQREQFQQSQANVLGGLRDSVGSSGIAALAQSLAQQGQIASQQSAASIGAQEAANQRMKATQAGRLQEMEARGQSAIDLQRAQGAANVDQLVASGAQHAQQMEMHKQATMLGMSQQEVAAYQQQAQDANTAKWNAISSGLGNMGSFIPGMMGE
jgi:hypothetical protein